MKNLTLSSFICLVMMSQIGYGQNETTQESIPNENDLCYVESMTQSINVTSDINTLTLSIQDKLKFKAKEFVKRHHQYFDENNDAVHDVHTVSHVNMYPEWYNKATLIRKSKNGVKSYFDANSIYHEGGWLGATKSTVQHGQYSTDGRTGEHYYAQSYTHKGQQKYSLHNSVSNSHGFLHRFAWNLPTSQMIQSFQSGGYSISSSSSVLTISSSEIILIWDYINRVHIMQELVNGEVKTTTTYKYELSPIFSTYLLSSTLEESPMVFSNGDCFTETVVTVYDNYQTCNNSTISNTNSNVGDKAEPKLRSFEEGGYSISPNPVNDILNINLPSSDRVSKLLISDISGKVIAQRKINKGMSSIQINTISYEKGIYIIQVENTDAIYTSKFVKQ